MLTSVEGIYENGVVHLLEELPGVARARVVVTVLPDAPSSWPQHPSQSPRPSLESREAEAEAEADAEAEVPTGDAVVDTYQPRTELGRKLIELRRAYIQAGGKLLSWDEIDHAKRLDNDEPLPQRREPHPDIAGKLEIRGDIFSIDLQESDAALVALQEENRELWRRLRLLRDAMRETDWLQLHYEYPEMQDWFDD